MPRGTGHIPRHLRRRRPTDRLHQVGCSCSYRNSKIAKSKDSFLAVRLGNSWYGSPMRQIRVRVPITDFIEFLKVASGTNEIFTR